MIGKSLLTALAVAGVALGASQAQADADLGFLNKYIDKYVKDDKVGDFDLNKLTDRLEKSDRLSSLRDRLGMKKKSPPKAPLTAQRP